MEILLTNLRCSEKKNIIFSSPNILYVVFKTMQHILPRGHSQHINGHVKAELCTLEISEIKKVKINLAYNN